MIERRTRALVMPLVALLVCAAPAAAQRPRPDRPYRGLFGGNGANPNSAQQLDLNVSLLGAYDDNVLSDRSQVGIDPRFEQSGNYEAGTASLDYTRRTGRVTFDFSGGTTYRYYPSLRQLDGTDTFASAGVIVKLSSRTVVRATESASYSPFFSFGVPGAVTPVPGDVAPTTPDAPLVSNAAVGLSSMASFEHRLTPRLSWTADYALQYTNYRVQSQALETWTAGSQVGYQLSTNASARFGYHYRRSTSPFYYAQEPVVGHDLDVGIDYSRALSFSRKTKVGFATGTSIFRSFSPSGGVPGTDGVYQTHYLLNGNAYLTRQMGRSWSGRLRFERGVQFVPGFGSPFNADTVSASLDGYAGLRQRLSFGASYSNGQVGIALSGQNYRSYNATADYQYALSSYMALSANYTYYRYWFADAVPLPTGLNRGLNRQSVRVGLSFWLPLVR